MTEEFKHLFTPLQIGPMTVRNRILSTGHWTAYGDKGLPSERHLNYWVSKAKGGIGLICTEITPVHPSGGKDPRLILGYKDEVIEPFKRIAEAVHKHGAKIISQIYQPGHQSVTDAPSMEPGGALWSVEPLRLPPAAMLGGNIAHKMDIDEIKELVEAYGSAAKRMELGGLDGVEIHIAHGYLGEQFMSPLTNTRDDEYGGDEERRLRFVFEVIDAVRASVSKNFVVGIRLSGDQFLKGGYNLDDMKRFAPRFAATGKLDYINVSYGVGAPTIAPTYFPGGTFVYLAAGIKEVVDLPVFCVGRITDPVQAEKILADNQADVIGMTRANICDPEMPNKAREGRLDEIRKCMGCNEGCWGRITNYLPITCATNPTVGREKELEIVPAATKKNVIVVGGGLAGMETARVAALRGHKVTLVEKGPQLGGQVLIAAKAGRDDLAEPPRYFARQMELLGVDVRLGTEATAETVMAMKPDAVVVATGSMPSAPSIRGVDQDNVVFARDILEGKVEAGENVIVYHGEQTSEGLTTADFLGDKGKKVEVLCPSETPGRNIEVYNYQILRRMRLPQKGVKVNLQTDIKEISGNTVVAIDVITREERRIEGIDTVVIAYGGKVEDSLYHALKGQVKELHLIGDAYAPRRMLDATLDGTLIGRRL